MRTISRPGSAILAAVILASCGAGDDTLSDALVRDLNAAQTSSIELATKVQDYQPTRFVTAVEQLPGAAPTRKRVPRRVYSPPAVADVPLQETAPAPEPTAEIVQTPIPVPEPEQPKEVSSVPVVVPRPAPTPATPAPSGNEDTGRTDAGPGRDEILGTIIGEVIGVVIRGGTVGQGHCPPRRGRGRGFPIPHDGLPPIVRPGPGLGGFR
ncbi:MAG: hypothetical protein ACT4R6_00500 [Gemmatimonadaceae bacterium]